MKRVLLLLMMLLAGVSALAQPDYSYGIDTRRDDAAFAAFSRRMDAVRRQRPVVALVLSGGGAKGAALVRVIQALDEAEIPIDMVLGTSVGGLIGGLYACGYSGAELETIMRGLDWDSLLSDSYPREFNTLHQKDYQLKYPVSLSFGSDNVDLFSRDRSREESVRGILPGGIVQGQNIRNLFSSLLPGYGGEIDFLRLPIPFVCVATDAVSASPKVWHCGNLIDALRSTMSIPGLFAPLRKDGMILMDGGLIDNFPAAIARKMGADIIIGVDISSPGDAEAPINSLLDIISHLMDLIGEDSYNEGVAQSDLYIRPDISGYSMLSFDARSIDSLILRGDKAAKEHAAEIQALRQALGRSPRPKNAVAVNTADRAVQISGISFSGVNSVDDGKYLLELLKLGHTVTKADLDRAVYTLKGTSAFESVTYSLIGEKEPFLLQFDCVRAPVHQSGVSFRFDTEENASLLLMLGLNAHRLTGHHLDLTGRLGLRTSLDADYSYRAQSGFSLGTEVLLKRTRNVDFNLDPQQFQATFNHIRGDAYLAMTRWNLADVRLGARIDQFNFTSVLSDANSPADFQRKHAYASLYAQTRLDSYDIAYFPRTGARYSLGAQWFFADLREERGGFYALSADFQTAASIGRFTILPSLAARYISDDVPVFDNYLSVKLPGRTLDQQIAFAGVNSAFRRNRLLSVAGLDLRLQIASKHYVTATGQYLRDAADLRDYLNVHAAGQALGFALEYAYNTYIGPIRADVHWSSLTHSVGVYLGIGFDF